MRRLRGVVFIIVFVNVCVLETIKNFWGDFFRKMTGKNWMGEVKNQTKWRVIREAFVQQLMTITKHTT